MQPAKLVADVLGLDAWIRNQKVEEMSDTRIVEVNGIKLEVDLRTARRVDSYRVGDKVKILVKKYGDEYESHPGVIVGFDEFVNLPTILVCYLSVSYLEASIKFLSINSKTEDVEIIPMAGEEDLEVMRSDATRVLDREIIKKEEELADLYRKRDYFLANFYKAFGEVSVDK